MHDMIALVLGGGRGTRLYPLTKYRSKPAVPVAGKYRIIDLPLSNCINSGIKRIYVLTQFNSVSLHRHIRQSYSFSSFEAGFVEILAAQQTYEGADWYQGTADAVRQNMRVVEQPGVEHVLILSGDQLYRMNFAELLATHRESQADVTIAAVPVARSAASGLGIMRVDDSGRVVGFLEKPQTEEEAGMVATDPAWIDARGIQSRGRDCLANMGIYLFNQQTLIDLLTKTDYSDFGKEIFPASIRTRRVQVHLFDGYWEDIGTIGAYFQANLELGRPEPPFVFSAPEMPIYTRARFLPPARIGGATIRNSMVADGCVIGDNVVIEDSVIGLRCKIGDNVTIRRSVINGADFYELPEQIADRQRRGQPLLGIGSGSVVEGAILDKNCRLGDQVRVVNPGGIEESEETAEALIRDGVVVVPRGAVLPSGWSHSFK